MKHIAKYRDWTRVHESDEPDQELEDIKYLADLGLAEPHQVKSMYREKYAMPRRAEFLAKLKEAFDQLGIEPFDYTTPRQAKNGTFYFQLAPAQVEKLLFEYPLPQGLTPVQSSRMEKMLREIEPRRDRLRARPRIDMIGSDYDGNPYRSALFQYFVYPQDIRGASWDKRPNSSGFVKFEGQQSADEILARFIYQLALDIYPQFRKRRGL